LAGRHRWTNLKNRGGWPLLSSQGTDHGTGQDADQDSEATTSVRAGQLPIAPVEIPHKEKPPAVACRGLVRSLLDDRDQKLR
jgi:hypothetical protein